MKESPDLRNSGSETPRNSLKKISKYVPGKSSISLPRDWLKMQITGPHQTYWLRAGIQDPVVTRPPGDPDIH